MVAIHVNEVVLNSGCIVSMTSARPRGNVTARGGTWCLSGRPERWGVIALPGEGREFVVRAVRLGQGGFLLTVSDLESPSPGAEWIITVTAGMRVFRHGNSAGL
jgi:hypothetical protein